MRIVVGILIFSLIILIHELGHFIFAKKNDICVQEFCIGFGPTIVGFTKGETKYSIKLLPLGGACMMLGEDEDEEANRDPRSFGAKSVWARMQVVLAGPVFNFILAFIFSLIVIGTVGVDVPVIGSLKEGGAAQAAGIKPGDLITVIDGENVSVYRDVDNIEAFCRSDEIKVFYSREGQTYTAKLKGTPVPGTKLTDFGFDKGAGRLKLGIFDTIKYSVNEVFFWIKTTLKSLGTLFKGRADVNDMQGPVGVVKVIANTYDRASSDGLFYIFINMVNIAILLTANLGVMNLLPIPALDGGRFVFLVVEAIRRRKLNPRIEGAVNVACFFVLLGLMMVVMFNDIRKIIFPG